MIDILYLNVTNKDWLDLSLKTIKSHLLNYNNIFIFQTNQNLEQFENVTLYTNQQLTKQVMIIEQNMGLLKDVNICNIPITYQFKNNNYIQDHIKPQLVGSKLFLPLINQQNPLTKYYKSIDRVGIPNNTFVVNVTKPICCTTKSLLTVKQYVKWNQEGFQSLKKYLNF